MYKLLIITDSALGDSVYFAVFGYQLILAGYQVAIFSRSLSPLSCLFPGLLVLDKQPEPNELDAYDYVMIYQSPSSTKALLQSVDSRVLAKIATTPLIKYKNYPAPHPLVDDHPMALVHGRGFYGAFRRPTILQNMDQCLRQCFAHEVSYPLFDRASMALRQLSAPPRVMIHPFSTRRQHWPLSYFFKLADQLLAAGYQVDWCCTHSELSLCHTDDIERYGLKPQSLPAFVDQCRYAALFIGQSSGPLHLAACVETPTLMLSFSGAKAKRWLPGFSANASMVTLPLCYRLIRKLGRPQTLANYLSVDRVHRRVLQCL